MDTYLKIVKMDTNFIINIVRSDNGLEFVNLDVKRILDANGICHQRTVPYTPEQNGSAEREMRTIVESARTMLHSKKLPIRLWAEAVNTAVYILNRTGNSSIEGVSPYELWFGKKPDIDHFKIFGSKVFTHIPTQQRKKWDSKAEVGVFVGYCDNTKGFRVWQPERNKVIISRDIIFREQTEEMHQVGTSDATTENQTSNPTTNWPKNTVELHQPNEAEDVVNLSSFSADSTLNGWETASTNSTMDEMEPDISETESSPVVTRPKNVRGMPKPNYNPSYSFLDDSSYYIAERMAFSAYSEPQSYEQALTLPDAEKWKEAINEEMKSLIQNKTWHLVDLPKNRRAISNRWVFKIKTKPNGDVDRYKARLVVKGFTQKYGIDYQETFSPVAKPSSIKMILSIAAKENLKLKQVDVKTAFLYGSLDEEIYMKQPMGFNDGSGRVCRIDKSIYGLKQASRCWNKKFTSFLRSYGLVASEADPCVFISRKEEKVIILAIYIDDGLLAVSDESCMNDFMDRMCEEFQFTIKDFFLGIEIVTNGNGTIQMHQEGYAKRILMKFGMDECNPVSIPMDPHQIATTFDHPQEVKQAGNVPYRELIGSLMYLATNSRPDIAYALSYASQHIENPSMMHWNALKRILRYLKGTLSFGIQFSRNFDVRLNVFSDADYAGDIKTRRSHTGFVLMLGSTPISWCSQKQKTVALSSTESEYIAASESVKELIWVQRLFNEIFSSVDGIPCLLCDNQSSIKLIKNPEFHKRTKHIDVKYHFIREKFSNEFFDLQYVSTENQIADILTKPLAKDKFIRFRSLMGIVQLNQQQQSFGVSHTN